MTPFGGDLGNLEPVTACLPVGPGSAIPHLRTALGSLLQQSHPLAEILILANGLDEPATAALAALLRDRPGPPALRLRHLPNAGLAAALNAGLRESRTNLVARMDADDWSHPDRLRLQLRRLRDHPHAAAIGCAWEVCDQNNLPRATIRPPTSPRRLAWSLLLGNSLAHGSILLRRDAVLAVGGYDESLARAQDYDLWLRLLRAGHTIAAAPEVLYRYIERTQRGVAASSPAQAGAAASSMLHAWSLLPPSNPAQADALARILGAAMLTENGGDILADLESLLDTGPTREALTALLWARDRFPPLPRRALDIARAARLREVAASIRAAGATRLWIWGAGQHTRWLLEHATELALPIAGIVDDALVGHHLLGQDIANPQVIPSGDHALLSSDWHESAMWESCQPHRLRGVHIWRLYHEPQASPEPPSDPLQPFEPSLPPD